ncbi:atrophin-1 [Fusarium albosuccineum]|uniref:Atrophin-1 n=1 Tax=Fusarium albosuccineum TaxID=1237068 RepID=A0A8H4L756_9HYPO|nr:atrophin-1 [Fusarium albosuccineum]
MIFSDIYKSPRSPIAKLRHHSVQLPTPLPATSPDWCDDEHADLLSKDKVKQKDAVKRYLETKVKNDWEFPWPSRVVEAPPVEGHITIATATTETPEVDQTVTSLDVTEPTKPIQDETRDDDGYQVDDGVESSDEDDDSDAESTYSTVSEDPVHYRPRMEWTSDLSDDDEPAPSRSPFRFDSPSTVGSTVQAAILTKRAKRRRAVRKEMEWNEGLACFEARRNAWTGARTVRIRTKPVSPPALSPRSPRRFFFRRSMSGSPPSSTTASTQPPQTSDGSDGSSLAKSEDLRKQQSKDTTPSTPPSNRNYPVEVLLPLAPPLLPPNNPLRASITPSVYLSLYDKVIIHSLQPSCPINLSDMLRACVAGWKRDGEWPPRPTMAPPAPIVKKKKPKKPSTPPQDRDNSSNMARRMSFGLLGRDKDDTSSSATGKGIRRSLVRALGIGAQDNASADRPREA